MTQKDFRIYCIILILFALMFIVTAIAVAQEPPRHPTGRIAPGPDSTPTPTPTPDPVVRKCEWVQTPWGGSRCDVRAVCKLNLLPMQIGTPRSTYVLLRTDKTKVDSEKLVPFESGGMQMSITWDGELKWAEWRSRASDEQYAEKPLLGCYCDEQRNKIVICELGVYKEEVNP